MSANGKSPKKKSTTPRKFTMYERTNPEREALFRALRVKFPQYSDIQIITAALETLVAFMYHGTDRISPRERMRILEDYWPNDDFKIKHEDGD